MIPKRVTASELSKIWNVTHARISQLATAGKIIKGGDGKFDLAACLAFRETQMSSQQINMLFQSYGNAHGTFEPKILDPYYDPDLDDEPAPEAGSTNARDVAVTKLSELSQLKAEEARLRLRRAETKIRREDGELIERRDAYRTAVEAGAEISAQLRTLEHDLPVIFADHETRREVRRKVEQTIDRCLYTLTQKFAAMAQEEIEDEV